MRNIVIFIDGTGQDRSKQEMGARTNVARLHDGCRVATSQSVKYCNGVGTDDYEAVTGNAFGIGIESRIIEAYIFLQQEIGIARRRKEEYRVFLFGFSRGAFAARWLAALIKYSGIPDFGVSERLGLYNFWNNNNDDTKKLKGSGKYYDIEVEMVGVWDTVQATITSDFGIRDVPDNVVAAYHAMALDEYRSKFEITRFNPSNKVTEVWFAGCHADVGGGYADGLKTANIALSWMINMAEEHGLLVRREMIPNFSENPDDDCNPIIHNEMDYDKPFTLKCLASSEFWTKLVWKMTNKVAGEDKHIRTVVAGDRIHPSVNIWQSTYGVAHLQNTSICTLWDSVQKEYVV